MTFVRYTVIYGGYDTLRPTPWRGVCFSDGSVSVPQDSNWEVHHCQYINPPLRLACRQVKVFPEEEFPAHYTLYHDGNMELLVPPELFVQFLDDCDIAAFRHPQRDCLYEEAQVCIECLADDAGVIKAQIEKYRQEGYPEHRGLFAGGILVRRDTPQIRELHILWWREFRQHSCRDQLSLNYALWKLGIECATIPGNLWDNPLMKVHPHKGKK